MSGSCSSRVHCTDATQHSAFHDVSNTAIHSTAGAPRASRRTEPTPRVRLVQQAAVAVNAGGENARELARRRHQRPQCRCTQLLARSCPARMDPHVRSSHHHREAASSRVLVRLATYWIKHCVQYHTCRAEEHVDAPAEQVAPQLLAQRCDRTSSRKLVRFHDQRRMRPPIWQSLDEIIAYIWGRPD